MSLWKVAALLAVVAVSTESGRVRLNKLLKSVLRAGYLVKESADDFAHKAKESADDFVHKAIEYRDELLTEIKTEAKDQDAESDTSKNGAEVTKV